MALAAPARAGSSTALEHSNRWSEADAHAAEQILVP
jgi:hypothetical protein